jgi:hypothetical protein
VRGLVLIGFIVAAWLIIRNWMNSSQPVAAASSPGNLLPPDPAQPKAPENPLVGISSSGTTDPLDNIGQAIANFESGGNPNALSYRSNNPGAIESGGQIRTYSDLGDGWDALNQYITSHAQANPQWDFYDFFQNYLGQEQGGPTVTSQGNSDAYAEYVANYLGVDPTTPVSGVLNGG